MQFSRPQLSEDQLREFESRNQVSLPDSYRRFLLAHNGGSFQFDYPAYKIPGDKRNPEGLLQCFFCLQKDDVSDIEQVAQIHQGRLPDGLLPIARDPGSNLICLGTTGQHAGKIYFWNRAKESSRPSFKNVRLISEDFQSFLDGLYPFEE